MIKDRATLQGASESLLLDQAMTILIKLVAISSGDDLK